MATARSSARLWAVLARRRIGPSAARNLRTARRPEGAAPGVTRAARPHGRLLWPVEPSPGFCQQPAPAAPHPCHRLHRRGHLFVAAGPSAADQALPAGPGLLHRLQLPLQEAGHLRSPRLLLDLCGSLRLPSAQPGPLPGCLLPPAQRSWLGPSLSSMLPSLRLCLRLPAS